MKSIIILLFVCVTAHISFAQDSTEARYLDTIALKPFFGLGLINGTRVGAQVQYGDIVALELGAGFDLGSIVGSIYFLHPTILRWVISQGVIIMPFKEKHLTLMLYNTYISEAQGNVPRYEYVWQSMIGWSIPIDELSNFRFSAGYAQRYGGNKHINTQIMYGLDFIMTFDHAKIRF